MSRPTIRWPGIALRLAAAALLVALGLELGIRLLRPQNAGVRALLYVPRFAPDFEDARSTAELLERSALGFSPFCNFGGYVLNSRGFLTPEYAQEKPAGALRIVALGDSFTFKAGGVPFDRQWTSLLRAELQRRLARPVELIGLGIPGVGPRFERRLFQLEGAALAPDVVLLGLYVGNDLLDEEGTDAAGLRPPGDPLREWLLRHSMLYRIARNLYHVRQGISEAERERQRHLSAAARSAGPAPERGGYEVPGYADAYRDDLELMTESEHLQAIGNFVRLNLPQQRTGFQRTLASVRETLLGLARDVAASGARLVVILIPDELQVDPALLRAAAQRCGAGAEDCDVDQPQREFLEVLAVEGIEHLDLLEDFRRAAAGERLYKPRDTHWNLAGNRLAAARIAAYLAPGT